MRIPFVTIKYCRGKACYDKKGAITTMNKRYRDDRVKLRIYPCNEGPHWHLTSKNVEEKRKWKH
jgi:hypothetical protein